eukprot:GILJ01013359.1.p1 GENE.GILJ01013359.1~~GILJ01013359.1.p1  ORF type:complete len:1213 (+),score=190.75 GILJ01013359.1:495-3641(+)
MGNWIHVHNSPTDTMIVSTPLDINSSEGDLIRLRRRRQGRLLKCCGDLCLLAGAVKEAQSQYVLAVEAARASGDLVWLGGALEGWAACLLADLEFDDNSQQPRVIYVEEVMLKYKEALSCYQKARAVLLATEAAFKMARYLYKVNRKLDALELLSRTAETYSSLGIQDQLVSVIETAILCNSMGFVRKFAFFMNQTVGLYREVINWPAAHHLTLLLAHHFHLKHVAMAAEEYPEVVQPPKRAASTRGWPTIQKKILIDLLALSKSMQDNRRSALYIVETLRLLYATLTDAEQLALQNELAVTTAALSPNVQVPMVGLPQVVKLQPLQLPPSLSPFIKAVKPVATTGVTVGDPFLFAPWRKKLAKRESIRWVQNDLAVVRVLVSNPRAFDVLLENVTISTTGVSVEAYPVSMMIPPKTTRAEFDISCRPLQTGDLKIRGLIIKAYNLTSEHLVDAEGKGYDLFCDPTLSTVPDDPDSLMNVTVVPSLPLLAVSLEHIPSDTPLHVMEGQQTAMRVSIRNIGTAPVRFLNVSMEELKAVTAPTNVKPPADAPDMKPSFVLDLSVLKAGSAALPLAIGEGIKLPLNLIARKDCVGGRISVDYAEVENAEVGRVSTLPIQLKVEPSLELVSVDISPLTASSSFSLLEQIPPGRLGRSFSYGLGPSKASTDRFFDNDFFLLSVEVRNTTINNFQLTCAVSDDTTSLIKTYADQYSILLEGLSTKRLALPMKRFTVEKGSSPLPDLQVANLYRDSLLRRIEFRWRSEGHLLGYLFLDSMLRVNPVHIRVIEPSPISFKFSLQGARLTVTKETTTDSDPRVRRSSSVSTLKRFWKTFSKAEAPESVDTPLEIAPNMLPQRTSRSLSSVSDSMLSPLHPNQRIPTAPAGQSFFLSTEQSTNNPPLSLWHPESVDAFTLATTNLDPDADPTQLESDPSVIEVSSYSYSVRQFHGLTVSISNRSNKPLQNLSICIYPFQDTENGRIDTNLAGKLGWIGSLEAPVDEILPGETKSHNISFCLYATGNFKFGFCCKDHVNGDKYWRYSYLRVQGVETEDV